MRTIAIMVLVGLAAAGPAQAQNTGSYYLRGLLGYTTQALGDVNDDIQNERSAFGPVATTLDWDDHGGAFRFGGEVGYFFSEQFSGGIGLAYQTSNLDHAASLDFVDGSGTNYLVDLGEDHKLSVLDVYATAAMWLPAAPGFHLGGQLGLARGKYELSDAIDLVASDGTFLVGAGDGEADGTTLSAAFFAGYEAAVSPIFGISGRLGYRFCNLGELEGAYVFIGDDETGPIFDSQSGPVGNSLGQPMEFDLSGFEASVALTMRLGLVP